MARTKFFWHLLALLTVAVWGVTFVSSKELISAGLRPAEIFAIRFLLAYVGILVISLFQRSSFADSDRRISTRRLWSRTWQDELLFLFLGISGGSLYFLTENTALAYTQASNVSFLVCSAPLPTALMTLLYKRVGRSRFARSLEDVRVGFPLVFGTLLALGGMALMLFDGARLQVSLRGDLLALAAALCWAVYSLFMGRLSDEYGSLFVTRKVFFYGLLTILPFLLGHRGFRWELLREPLVWGNLLFLGLVASLGCYVVWNRVLSVLGNVSCTNYVYLNPVFTLITAMLLLGERLTPAAATGSALILLGVILAGHRKHDASSLSSPT